MLYTTTRDLIFLTSNFQKFLDPLLQVYVQVLSFSPVVTIYPSVHDFSKHSFNFDIHQVHPHLILTRFICWYMLRTVFLFLRFSHCKLMLHKRDFKREFEKSTMIFSEQSRALYFTDKVLHISLPTVSP